jgi:inner membrane protein
MDTITHIVVGACIGESVGGKALGKRAIWMGALAQSIPDVDFIPQMWLSPTEDFLAHRGFTHSFLFGILATLILGFISFRIFRNRPFSRNKWFYLFSINVFAHLFIDAFNAYGTAWFEPFSDRRFSFHILYVADPFFSFWPLLAFIVLAIGKWNYHLRHKIAMTGLALAGVYLGYAASNKLGVDADLRAELVEKGIPINQYEYLLTPAPFNSWLWYVVAQDEKGFYVGYRSVFDKGSETKLKFFPRNAHLLDAVVNREEVENLKKFAGEYYTVEKRGDTTVFNVLRFGQIAGWLYPDEKFVFYYFLDMPEANLLTVQRGRFSKWDRKTFKAFLRRISGH